MAERVSFHPGKVEAEFVTHPVNLSTALDFLRSKSKEKRLIHGTAFEHTNSEHKHQQTHPTILKTKQKYDNQSPTRPFHDPRQSGMPCASRP
jgi:hypothetical protein